MSTLSKDNRFDFDYVRWNCAVAELKDSLMRFGPAVSATAVAFEAMTAAHREIERRERVRARSRVLTRARQRRKW